MLVADIQKRFLIHGVEEDSATPLQNVLQVHFPIPTEVTYSIHLVKLTKGAVCLQGSHSYLEQ